MSLKTLILSAICMSGLSVAFAASGSQLTAIEVLNPSETYIGSLNFQGGVLSRGEMTLPQATELKSLRFEIPGFCQARILQVGTVTEGISDLAQRTSDPSVFLVNGGLGSRVRSVFASLEGPQNVNCHVLVYGSANSSSPIPQPPPNDRPDSSRAVTCITNPRSTSFEGNVWTDGVLQSTFSIPAGRTTMFVTTLRPDRSTPVVRIDYDADPTPGYYVVQTFLTSGIQSYPDCRSATNYVVRQRPGSWNLEVVRY